MLDGIVSFVYKNTDNILISCEGFENRLREYVPSAAISWVPNWSLINYVVDESGFKLTPGFNFTFAGNVGKVQNLENVILGFKRVALKYDNVFLNIVGDGSNLTKLKEMAIKNNIRNVCFYGRRPLTEMPSLFNSSDVLIISLASADIFKLTIPSKFQAYLKSNKPIMGIIDGELKNMINKYKLGKVAHPDSVNEIGEVFEEFILEDKEMLKKIGSNAKQIDEELFNREVLVKKISAIISSN